MELRKAFFMLAFGGSLITAVTTHAQQRTAAEQPRTGAAAGSQNSQGTAVRGQAGWQNADQTLATCAAIANHKEVALAQLAKEKAKDDDVKEFANMLIKDHQAFLQKLQKYTPEAGSSRSEQNEIRSSAQSNGQPQSVVQPAAGTSGNTAGGIQQTSGTQPAGQNAHSIDFVQLHREISQQCLASEKKKLGEKDGKEFDKCFVGMQIAGHMAMVDKLTVFQKHSSGELQQLFADAEKTTKSHLEKAEKLMKDLDDSSDKKSKKD